MNTTNSVTSTAGLRSNSSERQKPSWIVDLCSFYVEADSEEEAVKEAWRMIEAGEAEIDIDQIARSAFD